MTEREREGERCKGEAPLTTSLILMHVRKRIVQSTQQVSHTQHTLKLCVCEREREGGRERAFIYSTSILFSSLQFWCFLLVSSPTSLLLYALLSEVSGGVRKGSSKRTKPYNSRWALLIFFVCAFLLLFNVDTLLKLHS